MYVVTNTDLSPLVTYVVTNTDLSPLVTCVLSVVKAGYSCSCAGDLVHPYKLCTSTMNNLNMYIYMGLHELQVELWGSRT